MSDQGATTTVGLVAGWDAALTYDVLATHEDVVFVGREELLGPLVDAISEPNRRGTYLVSGYRGAGKTSLVIEAARRAQAKLAAKDRRLLPLVLNVSEVSASLESAADKQMPALGIDARRLLTALLRALRNGIGEDDEAAAQVQRAYLKAEASQYTETAQERAETARTVTVETTRSVTVANALKAVTVAAGLGVVGVAGTAVAGPVPGICAALAGLAAVSYRASKQTSNRAADTAVASTEVVRDNSLHQVESDLKDILAALDAHKWRTMFVLEELDKVEDEHGQQLDAVIRYFKNLFTQAPALFFFLTDKEYFDVIDANMAEARRKRSYAVEHTFFTHRVFVSRPSLDECLAYFRAVLVGEEASAAVDQIAATRQVRSLPLSEMRPVERFLRVLLFASQNHLFDLKNEMRRYVRVDDSGARLAFDAESLPPQEQAAAALHFLLEQKALLYRFGGGRDYENEVLRNCLSGVFWNLGADDPQPVLELYPEPAELGLAQRARVVEAVDSLLGDLERGGAIETRAAPTEPSSFSWRANAAVVFNPAPRLEAHEQALQEQLERASRVLAQFGADGPLANAGADHAAVEAEIAAHAAMIEEIRRASRPLTVELAQRRSAAVAQELASPLSLVQGAHQGRLSAAGWLLMPVPISTEGTLRLITRGHDPAVSRVLLVYGTDAALHTSVQRALATLPPMLPSAVVLVDEDPATSVVARRARLGEWRSALADADRPVLVTLVPLAEELESAAAADAGWGERTADELMFARMWIMQRDHANTPALPSPFAPPVEGPVWLAHDGQEQRHETLEDGLVSWFTEPETLLGAPPRAGNDPDRLLRAFVELAVRFDRPALLVDRREWLPAPVMPDDQVVRDRLAAAGRLLTLVDLPYLTPPVTGTPAVVCADTLPVELAQRPLTTLRTIEQPYALRALAEFVEPADAAAALALFEAAATSGDAEAIGQLIVRRQRAGDPQGAQDWSARLRQTGDVDALFRAGEALPPEQGIALLEAAADAGSAQAMASLLIRRPDTEAADRLLATGDWAAVRRGAQGVQDEELGARLLTQAAEAGDLDALEALVRAPWAGRHWDERLIEAADSYRLWSLAVALDREDTERGLTFHRAAADKGDTDSMREVLVRGDAEAASLNRRRLLERDEWDRLEAAAARLEGEHPERAAEIRALVEKRQAGDEAA